MRSAVIPEIVEVAPGEHGLMSVTITNTTAVIDAYRVEVFGLDPAWVTTNPARLSLFPGQSGTVDIDVTLPADYPASQRKLTINVVSDDDRTAFSMSDVELTVKPRHAISMTVDPSQITGGRGARFALILANSGNTTTHLTATATDPEELAEFSFEPTTIDVPPGRERVIEVVVRGGRSWFGQPRPRTMMLGVTGDQHVESLATFIQRPRIGRWLLSLLGLLTAATVFALVLSQAFDSVVDEARISNDVLNEALQRDEAGGAVVPTDPGTVTGTVITSSTGSGLSGAQAELFVSSDTVTPVASAATGSQGEFTLSNLGAGRYTLRLSGAGVAPIWFGGATNAADAATFDVQLGVATQLEPIEISGTPTVVTGAVDVDDTEGVTVSLVVPGAEGAAVATVPVNPDGSFSIPDVPTPGNYQLIVQQPGVPPVTRDLVLEPGVPLGDLGVDVVAGGGGTVSGQVNGPTGPLGGATITATTGTSSISTLSLTESPVGSYNLRGLAVPGQYTITIDGDGFSPQSRTVSLTAESTDASFSATLTPAIGSISGRAVVDGGSARGISVVVTGVGTNREVGAVTQGANAGSFTFRGLDAPGTYTLAFTGDGLVPQVRVVDLDPQRGITDVADVAVTLTRERTLVNGVVRGVDGRPVGGATVTLSDGTNNRVLPSADSPAGAFAFSDVEPGAYTLSASLTGTEPVVVLVNVNDETTPALDLQLGAQASLHGQVTGYDPAARRLPVRLFLPEQFPNGEPLATTFTDASGAYSFEQLEAPTGYVVAVYASDTAADPLDSATAQTAPGAAVDVPALSAAPLSESSTTTSTPNVPVAPAAPDGSTGNGPTVASSTTISEARRSP